MNASPEQIQIVRTVVNEFAQIADNVPCAQRILAVVLKFVEGEANQASTRREVRDALSEAGREMDDARLNLCIETANTLAQGYFRWTQDQDADELDIYPAWQLSDRYQGVWLAGS